jgi:hypothetical protein
MGQKAFGHWKLGMHAKYIQPIYEVCAHSKRSTQIARRFFFTAEKKDSSRKGFSVCHVWNSLRSYILIDCWIKPSPD